MRNQKTTHQIHHSKPEPHEQAKDLRLKVETDYQSLFELSRDIILFANRSGSIIDINPRGAEISGYLQSELRKMNLIEHLVVEDDHMLMRNVLQDLIHGRDRQYLVHWRTKEGKTLRFSGSSVPRFSSKGTFLHSINTLRDITQYDQMEEALSENLESFQSSFDHAAIGMTMMDPYGRWLRCNRFFCELVGYSEEELLRMDYRDITYEEDLNLTYDLTRQLLMGEISQFHIEKRYIHKQGHLIWAILSISLVRDERGTPLFFFAQIQDINERKRLEENNRRRAEGMRKLETIATKIASQTEVTDVLETAVIGLASEFPELTVRVYLNDRKRREVVLEAVAGEVRSKYPLGMRQPFGLGIIGSVATNEQPYLASDTRQDANYIPCQGIETLSELAIPITFDQETIGVLNLDSEHPNAFDEIDVQMMGLFADNLAANIQRAILYKQVQNGNERMRKLSRQLITAQEEERRRFSRELHDEAGQALTALKIYLNLIRDQVLEEAPTLRQQMEEVMSITGETMERIHMLAEVMRPPGLDQVGLAATLEDLCRGFARIGQLSIHYQAEEIHPLTDEANMSLYRFLQEALTNVIKHSRAKRVWVMLSQEREAVSLSVQDDGKGFDEQKQIQKNGRGIGLIGMRERLELLGGQLEVETRPGYGARLVARIPLEEYARKRVP